MKRRRLDLGRKEATQIDPALASLTTEQVYALADAEGLCLIRSPEERSATGFYSVQHHNYHTRLYQARDPRHTLSERAAMSEDMRSRVSLGYYNTPAQAALALARVLGPDGSEALNKRLFGGAYPRTAAEATAAATVTKAAAQERRRLLAEERAKEAKAIAKATARAAAEAAAKERQRLLAENQKRLLREAALRRQQAACGAPAPSDAGCACEADGERLPLLEDLPASEIADWVLQDHHGAPFRCLGLESHMPAELCRKRYLRLAFLLHPDKFHDARAAAAFAAIEHANESITSLAR